MKTIHAILFIILCVIAVILCCLFMSPFWIEGSSDIAPAPSIARERSLSITSY
jgi:hypothetical protein